MKKYDVIVVGAGPAGAITSYYLSRKGFNVALLEKSKKIINLKKQKN